ncbi:hypothetical protein EDB89DRAFT_260157 [Lactarius sanguifluus]|nr:hypothetical protein EDB89DRAFT_260157 [Lactarius sanguifluus]
MMDNRPLELGRLRSSHAACPCATAASTLRAPRNSRARWTRAAQASIATYAVAGTMYQTLVEEVSKIGGKLRSLVVAMMGGGYGAEDARKLFEALFKEIDASTYDAPLQSP